MNPIQLHAPTEFVSNDPTKHEYLQWRIANERALEHIGTYMTFALEHLHQHGNLPDEHLRQIRACYTQWLEYSVVHAPWVQELFLLKIPAAQRGQPPRRIVESLDFHAFFELSRMWYTLHYTRLRDEQQSVLAGRLPMSEADVCLSIAECKERSIWLRSEWSSLPAEWKQKPFLSYTQQEIKLCIMIITENLSEYPACHELVRVIELLYMANAVFFCTTCSRDVMNAEFGYIDITPEERHVSRDYISWSTVYFGQLLRRIYYLRLAGPNRLADPPTPTKRQVEQFREWVSEMVKRLPEDNFEDLHGQIVDECYSYPGDDTYLHFRWPDRTPQRGEILSELRPNKQKAYNTEKLLSKESVLAEDNHVTRMFVLGVFDQILAANYGFEFKLGSLVYNEDIESRDIDNQPCPLLVEIFSHFWLHDAHGGKGYVMWSNDIYETCAAWLLRIDRDYAGIAYRSNLRPLLREVFYKDDEGGSGVIGDTGFAPL